MHAVILSVQTIISGLNPIDIGHNLAIYDFSLNRQKVPPGSSVCVHKLRKVTPFREMYPFWQGYFPTVLQRHQNFLRQFRFHFRSRMSLQCRKNLLKQKIYHVLNFKIAILIASLLPPFFCKPVWVFASFKIFPCSQEVAQAIDVATSPKISKLNEKS